MRILPILLLMVFGAWSAGCGDDADDGTGIPCILDDMCQPACESDPDCKNGNGGDAGGAAGSGGTGGNGPPLDLDDAGGPDPACPSGVVSGGLTVTRARELSEVAGCTAIAGDLVVEDVSISDFERLTGLTAIGGSLIIGNNSQLTSLSGLADVVTVGGDLIINYNKQLGDISALSSLSGVGGDLRIRANTALAALEGLGNLKFIGGDLYIRANTALASLAGLGSPDDVLVVAGALHIGQNSGLPTCEAASLGNRVHASEEGRICENFKDECGVGTCPEVW